MNNIILKAENISKQYRLGSVGTGTISHDLNRWWHKVRGKEDPFLKVGESNDRSTKGESEYVWALKDINFEVQRGEVLGIIGKNGAGKSTLLKILSRVTSPTTGEIKTKGRIASLLEVGTGFHPEMTGRENVYLNGAILGMTKKEITSKLDEIIAFSGCERYIDTPVKRYSSGMTVRLAFAVAAHLEPDILVIDEVLAVGDAEFQKKAIGKMQDISKTDGRTVLFVSHNMGAIKELCTRALLIENGKIMFRGTPEDTINKYMSFANENFNVIVPDKRRGNGVIFLNNLKIYSHNENENPIVGKPLNIKLFIENNKIQSIENLRVDVRIDDMSGQKLAWLSTIMHEYEKEQLITEITFKIEKLNLGHGIYCLTTFIEVNGVVADWIQNAFTFEIFEGNFYKNNIKVPKNQGKILMEYNVEYN